MDTSQTALFNAAHVIRLIIDPTTSALEWDGFVKPVQESLGGTLPVSVQDFLKSVHPNHIKKITAFLNEHGSSSGEFSLAASSAWVFRYHRDEGSKEVFIHCFENSKHDQSDLQHTHELNSRLKLGMSEAHHRVKNTLQNVISYMNVMLGRRPHLDREDVQKLVLYIHALTSLHDILLEEVQGQGDGKTVRLDRILGDVLTINAHNKSIEWGNIPELFTTPRQAATLSLIINELLDNASKFGQGTVTVKIEEGELRGVLEVSNTISETPSLMPEGKESRGLEVARLLAKADLQSALEVRTVEGRHTARLEFPIEKNTR